MSDSSNKSGSIDTPELLLTWSEATWDSVLFGSPVLQIGQLKVRGPSAANDFSTFESCRDQEHCALVSCRLPHDHLKESMLLESHGFRFIEMVYHPEISDLQALNLTTSPELMVSRARSIDLPIVQDIAGHAFHNERFHVDPRLDHTIGNKRYQNWATSSFDHPSQQLYCVRDSQRVLAFFVTEQLADGTCYWHLNAVAPEAQGKGFGMLAWRAMMLHARSAGAQRIRTCIAARNHRVLNLYARLGFSFSQPEMTFHWVREN